MIRNSLLAALCALILAAPQLARAQDTAAARAEGKAFGREAGAAAQRAATTTPDAGIVPNYTADPAQSGYRSDPDRLTRDAAATSQGHDGYRTMRDSIDRRARIAPIDIETTIARSRLIADDPLSYTSGMAISGNHGRCVSLPPASSPAGRYQATCNTGYSLGGGTASCNIGLTVTSTQTARYRYYAEVGGHTGLASNFSEFQGAIAAGTCTDQGATDACAVTRAYGFATTRNCASFPSRIAECSQIMGSLSGLNVVATGEKWFARETSSIPSVSRDESACAALAADPECTNPSETCTDNDPVTRDIGGVPVTQPCWAWRRDYQCQRLTPADDCAELAATPGCVPTREYCLTDDQPCRSVERVYDCPLPEQPGSANQFICDGDIYCIDGACETIAREANDEFKDAVVALGAINQARRELDPATLRLFEGTRETCSSKVFGILNCCKGKGFPLIPGIQLLVALGCSREEMLLHERDAQGLCAYVGSYCSSSALGVCLTKRKAYCCFESKLSRILQEQGRAQLGYGWGKPKEEACEGFLIEQFAQLDLSQMDFSEVYAEFTEAARLPDELEAASTIQQKIEDYYARAGH